MASPYPLIRRYLVKFLQNELYKTGLGKAVMGLSGGIDSAVVAVLAQEAFGDALLCVMMPSISSSPASMQDAQKLCEVFGIRSEVRSIAPLVESFMATTTTDPFRLGNFSARMRMATLYDLSFALGALVLGTSNKSELMLGYGTLCGDLASAINPIGDLYKSEIFAFARHLGIPDAIIDKPPSADLWEGQSDEQELGYRYAEIDEVLFWHVENRLNRDELLAKGFDAALVDMLLGRIYKNQFKRKPPLIAKLTARTIGIDFLYPRDIKM